MCIGRASVTVMHFLDTPSRLPTPLSISTHSYGTRQNFIQAALSPDVQGKMGCSLRVVYPAPGAYDSSKVIFFSPHYSWRIVEKSRSRQARRRAGRETGQHFTWEFRRGCAPFVRISQAGGPPCRSGRCRLQSRTCAGGSNLPMLTD